MLFQIVFSEKTKKSLSSAEFSHREVKVKISDVA